MNYELILLTIKIGFFDHEVYLLSSDYSGLEEYAQKYLNKYFGEDLDYAEWIEQECNSERKEPIAIDLIRLEPGEPVIIGE